MCFVIVSEDRVKDRPPEWGRGAAAHLHLKGHTQKLHFYLHPKRGKFDKLY